MPGKGADWCQPRLVFHSRHLWRPPFHAMCPFGHLANSWGMLFIELRNIRHRSEQLERLLRKRQKALALIEAAGCLILCIDNNGERCDLATDCAKQSVGKQEAAVASSLIGAVDSKPAQERRWNESIPGKFTRDVDREFGKFHAGRRKRVVAANGIVWQHKHEWRCHLLAGVLPGL